MDVLLVKETVLVVEAVIFPFELFGLFPLSALSRDCVVILLLFPLSFFVFFNSLLSFEVLLLL